MKASNISIILVVCLCLGLLGSCTQPKYMDKEALNAYVNDEENGLFQKKEAQGHEIKLNYRPTGLLIAQELGDVTTAEAEKLKKLQDKYGGQYYFILSLSRGGREALSPAYGGQQQFSENLQTLAFRMGEYVNLTTSASDTIAVADYVFPRTYGMSGTTQLMFAFDKTKAKDTDWVQFNLAEMGLGIGRQNFRFETSDLEKAPQLKVSAK